MEEEEAPEQVILYSNLINQVSHHVHVEDPKTI
jgi:hypothetical protein